MNRLDDLVYEAFTERVFERMTSSENQPSPRDNSAALEDLADAKQQLVELQASEEDLAPVAYARAETKILARIEEAEKAVAAQPTDLDKLAEEAMPYVREEIARVSAGGRPLDGIPPEGIKTLRALMAREIRAVFVRPAATRSNKALLTDRVRIVWSDDPEEIELPRRGEVFAPTPYRW